MKSSGSGTPMALAFRFLRKLLYNPCAIPHARIHPPAEKQPRGHIRVESLFRSLVTVPHELTETSSCAIEKFLCQGLPLGLVSYLGRAIKTQGEAREREGICVHVVGETALEVNRPTALLLFSDVSLRCRVVWPPIGKRGFRRQTYLFYCRDELSRFVHLDEA